MEEIVLPILIQAAIPLGADLVRDVANLWVQSSSGVKVTDDQWRALGQKWASKSANQYLADAVKAAKPLY